GVWFAVSLAGLVVALITLRRAHLNLLTMAAVVVAVLAIGAERLQSVYFSIPRDHIVTYTGPSRILSTIRGRVVSYPQIFRPEVEFGYRPDPRIVFLLESDAVQTSAGWETTSGLVRISIDEPYKSIEPGERVELTGWMGRFRPPSNPGQYDTAAAARRSGTRVWFRVYSEGGVKVLEPAERGWTRQLLWRVRATVQQHLVETGDLQSGQLVSALILGERHPALATLNRTMKQAGISHFLSISGLHLGVFLGFVYLFCRVLMLSPRKSAAAVLVILVCYLLLAEPRPALLRSAIMAVALLAGVIWSRPNSSLNALSAAAIILLLIDPRQLFAPGFQLSFIIVAGLILLYRPVRNLLFGRWIRQRGLIVFRNEQRVWRWVYFTLGNLVMDIIAISVTAYLI
ncbi:MAG: ComEC/Rec2 family competence protein, partial [Candidatus Hydrogenedentes bacterium]|nr:ComEC/Rec2 family competence protein [Candidatus Hydrogenedentota bacterium]